MKNQFTYANSLLILHIFPPQNALVYRRYPGKGSLLQLLFSPMQFSFCLTQRRISFPLHKNISSCKHSLTPPLALTLLQSFWGEKNNYWNDFVHEQVNKSV